MDVEDPVTWKRSLFEAGLRDLPSVVLRIDARRNGVQVPEALRGEAGLALEYGMSLPVPIVDLEVTDYGVSAVLSFDRRATRTLIPWSAVWAITDGAGHGCLFEEPPDEAKVNVDRKRGRHLKSVN